MSQFSRTSRGKQTLEVNWLWEPLNVCAACATSDWLQFFHVAPAAAVCVFVANAISSDGLQLGLNSFSLDMVQVVDMMPHVMGL